MSELKEVPCRPVDCPALGVVAALAAKNNFGYALVGGAVRDAYHHRQATDHDIAVWRCDSINDVVDIGYALEELGYVQEAYHEDDPEYNADAADGRYECIIEYSHPLYPAVDILVFSSEFGELSDVLDSFDFNLNQFAQRIRGCGDERITFYGGDQLYSLKQLRSSTVTEERRQRMIDKALDYGWIAQVEAAWPQTPLLP